MLNAKNNEEGFLLVILDYCSHLAEAEQLHG
jgi:hypothetical protein